MSFVGVPFQHDVFISYSHGDVRRDGQALLKQWSQGFARELDLELQAFPELGAKINVFLDESHRPDQGLDPMAPLTDTLRQDVAASAILALLMTPHYLGSQWCRDEREWWIEAQGAHGLRHEKRIAIARVWPTNSDPWPRDLLDDDGHQHLGHTFYDKTKADMRPQPYSWPLVGKEPGEFRDALLDFVGRLRLRLRELKQELDLRRERKEEQARLKGGGQALYLHGRESQAHTWNRVQLELLNSGYGVFPREPEPVDGEAKSIRERAKKRISIMKGCDAILLLGTEDADALVEDLPSIGRFDRQEAIALSNRSLPCSVLDTVGSIAKDPIWKLNATNLGIGWVDASVSPWTHGVQAWLQGAAR